MSFDPNTYDPFAGYDPLREIRQRINRVNSEAGLPAVLDWSPEDVEAKLLAHGRFVQTRNHDMRRLAAATVEEHLRWRDPHDVTSAVRGPSALFAFDTRIPFSLADNAVENLVARYLSDRYTVCDVAVDIRCERANADHVLIIGYGEWVCLYKCCDRCKAWFDDPDRKLTERLDWPYHDLFDAKHPASNDGYRYDEGND